MQGPNNLDKSKEKIFIASLINDVLIGKKTVSDALLEFPDDREDIDIKCAFDALIYYEADEDLRKLEQDYALVQDEYLSDIAELFIKNEPLPKNIVEQYQKYNKDNLLPDYDNSFKGIIKKIKRMINF